ncbi:Ribosomal protein S12 methylthiotransferase RimO [Clostridium bornimense]|uniref:Ribosomal protein uS12 methylthiotransferase RimO n=1 Tax=Clostridium bornimense TaxID=1216932 RepID=W6RVX6_9CLOT|nr:30S ribosomal protein S12 methylthiotransferase RimO [Clostridium bornimense]CDM68851.1 Ribosomal protein S12 methylthiotransferase RimO [Clostridium bornimense]
MKKYKVGLVSLGCDKNRIDSEIILGNLSENYEITNDPKKADIIIVNTCGFIESSKQESIDTILEMSEYKNKYNCKVLVATGCLTQRYGKELLALMPELDFILGVNGYGDLLKLLESKLDNKELNYEVEYSDTGINEGKRILTTGTSSAYIRIAEGCNNTCSYCIIPKIRGRYRSRTIESILKEAEELSMQGVKELILVAQDTTRYGTDIYKEKRLHVLLQEISKIEGIEWIRVLYCYPEELYEGLIDEIANNPKVVKYLDIPIQHISNNILKAMRRRTKKETITAKIDELRKRVPEIALRTSLIVGFPGETEEDFNELVDFVKEYKIDNLGVFTYSKEEDTLAAEMDNQVDEEVKEKRKRIIMTLQSKIFFNKNKNKIGKKYRVLVENIENNIAIGRNYAMAPDIDGAILIKCDTILTIGNFYDVEIIDTEEYDLIGVVQNEFS